LPSFEAYNAGNGALPLFEIESAWTDFKHAPLFHHPPSVKAVTDSAIRAWYRVTWQSTSGDEILM
jgi:hypothetical protein